MLHTHAVVAGWLPAPTQMLIGFALFVVIIICTRRWSVGCSLLMIGAYTLALLQPALAYGAVTLGTCGIGALVVMLIRGPRTPNKQ